MKLKPKGRKIYRYKTRFERIKGFFRNSGAVVMTIAGTAVLVFVGYSAGGPIMRFLEEQNIISPQSAQEPTVPEQTAAPQEVTAVSETPAPSEAQPTDPAVSVSVQMQGYCLTEAALSTAQTLRDALAEVPAGTSHVFVPLKAKGGSLFYATSITDAGMAGAVVAAVPLTEIHSIISEAGYIPAAMINALEDNVYPQIYADAAYTAAGSTQPWRNADGKPLLSPFSPLTKEYLCDVTAEISGAGFSTILCEGMAFPDFSEEELAALDPRAGADDRGTVLAHLLTDMQEAASITDFYIAVSGEELLAGDADILRTGERIAPDAVVVSMPAGASISEMQEKLDGIPCIPSYMDDAADAEYYIIRQNPNVQETADPTETTAP